MNKKYLFFTLILSNFCNHYSFTMDNQAPNKSTEIKDNNNTNDDEKRESRSKFWDAMKDDNLDIVMKFIANKWIDKNDTTSADPKESLLYFAVRHNSFNVVKYLIAIGANINTKPYHPLTLAMNNAYNIDIRIVQLLIEKGADLKFIDPGTNQTPLHCAVCTHHYVYPLKKAKIKYFLEQLLERLGPDEALKIIQAKDIDNKTAADYALMNYREEIYQLLKTFEKDVLAKAQEKTNATKTN